MITPCCAKYVWWNMVSVFAVGTHNQSNYLYAVVIAEKSKSLPKNKWNICTFSELSVISFSLIFTWLSHRWKMVGVSSAGRTQPYRSKSRLFKYKVKSTERFSSRLCTKTPNCLWIERHRWKCGSSSGLLFSPLHLRCELMQENLTKTTHSPDESNTIWHAHNLFLA